MRLEVPLPPADRVMLGALSEIAGPEGDIEAARLTVPANPFTLVSVSVDTPEEPVVIDKLLGLAVIAKSGCGEGLTITVTATAWDDDPLVLVIVTT